MGYGPRGRRKSDTTETLIHTHTHTHIHTHTPEMWERASPKGVASVCPLKHTCPIGEPGASPGA